MFAAHISAQRSSLTASASPLTLSTIDGSVNQTSASTTCTPSGGVAPYTYSWAFVVTDPGISITSPSSASTTFKANGMASSEIREATAQCTVTDSALQTAESEEVTIYFERT